MLTGGIWIWLFRYYMGGFGVLDSVCIAMDFL
jgi:hypothetical protein